MSRRRRQRRRRARSRRRRVLAGSLILLAMVGLGSWLWLRSGSTDSEPTSADGTTADSGPTPAPTTDPAPLAVPDTLDLPELEASDVFLREVLAAASEHPEWTAWLVGRDLARRFVTAVVRVSRGASPAPALAPLEPEGDFRVREHEGETVIDAASYRRYDVLVETFTSLDYAHTVRLYERLHPLFEEAHQELGFPEGTFDDVLARAVERVLAVEMPDGPMEVVSDSTLYRFEDPAIESQSPLAKHLFRMGPGNAGRLQAKIRNLAEALELLGRG